MLGSGQAKVSSNVLRQVEQTDLIQYGLIPEFVGRFPVISSLQVCSPLPHLAENAKASSYVVFACFT